MRRASIRNPAAGLSKRPRPTCLARDAKKAISPPDTVIKQERLSTIVEAGKSPLEAKLPTERERRQTQPGRSDMATLRYAGIGARVTPAAVQADMGSIAGWLARTAWHLSSGGGGRGRYGVRQGCAGRATDDLAAVAGV